MKEKLDKRPVIVGIFVLAGLLFLVAGILIIGNLHETFSSKIRIMTVFTDVNGLQTGNNIWFSGVKIGTVKKVEFAGKSQVRVTMRVDKKAQPYIRKDAKVKISSEGLIGNKILVIYGGSYGAGEVQDGDMLSVESVVSTEDLLKTLQESNTNVLNITKDIHAISQKITKGEGTLGKFLSDDNVYNNIDATTESLKNASDKAEQLLTSLTSFGSKLNRKGNLANDLVTDTVVFNSVKSSVKQLNKSIDSVNILVSSLKSAESNTKAPVGILLHDEKSGSDLKEIFQNLRSGSKKLDQDLEALQHNFLFRKYFKKKAKEDQTKK